MASPGSRSEFPLRAVGAEDERQQAPRLFVPGYLVDVVGAQMGFPSPCRFVGLASALGAGEHRDHLTHCGAVSSRWLFETGPIRLLCSASHAETCTCTIYYEDGSSLTMPFLRRLEVGDRQRDTIAGWKAVRGEAAEPGERVNVRA